MKQDETIMRVPIIWGLKDMRNKIVLLLVVFIFWGCVRNEANQSPQATTKTDATSSLVSVSTTTNSTSKTVVTASTTLPNMPDKGPVPNVGVNVYHVTNDQTCDAALRYLAQEPKLAYLMKELSPNRCYPMKYGLRIGIGDGSYLEFRENDKNEFYYSFSLRYDFQFTYTKDGQKKYAEFHVMSYESSDKTSNEPYPLYLDADLNYFHFIYDEATNRFLNTNIRKFGQKLIFTSDLTKKLLDAIKEVKGKIIKQNDATLIAKDIIEIIKTESRYSSIDASGFKKIDDVDFDYIYPFVRKGYVFGSDFSFIDDYFVIEKNGKYGLVNNNGLVVVDMKHDDLLFLMQGNEIYWHSGGEGMIPFTTYYFGGAHGLGVSLLFYDKSLSCAMVMRYGDDGPGVYSMYKKNEHDVVPILPYQLVDECKWIDDYSCSFVNRSVFYGLLSHDGRKLTEPLYQKVLTTRSPLVAVACGDQWGYVNHEGKLVIDCMYKGIWEVNDQLYPYPPMNDYIIVKHQSGKFGVIDLQGNTLVPFEYDVISPYYDNQIIMRAGKTWTKRIMD